MGRGIAYRDRERQGVAIEPTGQELFPTIPCISSIPGGQMYIRRVPGRNTRNSAFFTEWLLNDLQQVPQR